MSDSLIATARKLLKGHARRPRHSDLCRAVSTAYYALFHAFARQAADLMVAGSAISAGSDTWCQIYRSLNHGPAKSACQRLSTNPLFSANLKRCASAFVQLQALRHDADYNPTFRTNLIDATDVVQMADDAIRLFCEASKAERLHFITQLLFSQR